MKRRFIYLMFTLLLSSCSTMPMEEQVMATDPVTGALLKNPDGSYIVLKKRISQETKKFLNKLKFISGSIAPDAKASSSGCSSISPPGATASPVLWANYYGALSLCNSKLSANVVYAMKDMPHDPMAQMYIQTEKTERFSIEQKGRNIDRWINGIFRTGELLTDIYEIENSPGDLGSGGIYVKGDVVTHQTASTSGAASTGDAGGEAGTSGASSQSRFIGQSVFGPVHNNRTSDGSRNSSTGLGGTQQLEPSATGGVINNSDSKGFFPIDEQNAGITFDDKDEVGKLDL